MSPEIKLIIDKYNNLKAEKNILPKDVYLKRLKLLQKQLKELNQKDVDVQVGQQGVLRNFLSIIKPKKA